MTRTAKMCECGIKPVYVFDGKPPDRESLSRPVHCCAVEQKMWHFFCLVRAVVTQKYLAVKKGTLDDRKEKREESEKALAEAREQGDQEVNAPTILLQPCHCASAIRCLRFRFILVVMFVLCARIW